ncbi:SET domain [Babesia microti strain RI]|uniref:SET domain n=1 Tax=Babesia microti (strain RI) TaxID=1133968 RepID=A0A1R4ABQ6_BABMR|nr:SET domain [Babesia microti strain RI]SJK86449.1 SET domain [Babesia microti strain RI]|eukprot:XP_021338606.1 SET domain [Babesia microti strain RI]
MSRVSVDIRAAQNATEQYLLSHENQIKSVSRRLCNAVNNSLIFTSEVTGSLDNISWNRQDCAIDAINGATNDSNLGEFTDIILYSWYEAHTLVPKKITASHGSENMESETDPDIRVSITDGQQNPSNNDKNCANHLANIANNCTRNTDLKHHQKCVECAAPSVYVEKCWFTKLPPLGLPNQRHIDLDKRYYYNKNGSDMHDANNNDNITYKRYDFHTHKWLDELRDHTNIDNDNMKNYESNELSVIPTLKCVVGCKSFSAYEENVKFGGWPIPSDDMELGVWVYTSPFLEHCSIDIPTQYVCQVQHMHKRMFKDVETNRITMWCKRYNYNSPDFINSDSEDDNNYYDEREYRERSSFSNPFADIERNVDDANKLEITELYRNLAISSSTFVAPCNGYHLKIYGESIEELETTFLRNKMNNLYAKHRRHNLLHNICSRIRNITPKNGFLSPFPVNKVLRLAKSGVHGFGLFAGEDIKKGEFIIEYAGVLVTDAMTDVREDAYEKCMGSSTYLFRADDNRVIDATKTGNLARFVNHSCDPNAYTNTVHDEYNGPHVGIYASRDIAPGQEIFYNYRLSESVYNKEYCYCGSSNCSGRM